MVLLVVSLRIIISNFVCLLMKLIDYNGSSSLMIDSIEKIGDRARFHISAFLYDKKTDTNISYETVSFVEIDEWQEKSKLLITENKLELENFSFHALLDQMYSWDTHKISNYNIFELSTSINNTHLRFMIESKDVFGRDFIDEISDIIQYQPSTCDVAQVSSVKDNLIYVNHKIVGLYKGYEDIRCDIQLLIKSNNFRMERVFADFYESALYTATEIQKFNNGYKDSFILSGEHLRIDFKWEDGRKRGIGSIDDLAYPDHNELIIDDYVNIESA